MSDKIPCDFSHLQSRLYDFFFQMEAELEMERRGIPIRGLPRLFHLDFEPLELQKI
jgi:hypothetical protein